jgi:hypothetical protein
MGSRAAKRQRILPPPKAAEPRNDAPLNGGGGADKIQPGAGSDTMDGGAHSSAGDTVKYNDASTAVTVQITFAPLPAFAGGGAAGDIIVDFENVTGSAFDDVLLPEDHFDGSFRSVVSGIGGNDDVETRDFSGGDTANGGPGVDTCDYDIGGDAAISCP